jgi:hypothetical protein
MNTSIQVLHCLPGEERFVHFTAFAETIYPGKGKGVLDIDQEYLLTCLLAVRNNETAGRLSIYLNPHIRHLGKKTLLIGNFEIVNDHEVMEALMEELMNIAKKEEAVFIIGPMNGSTWNDYRFTIDNRLRFFFSEMMHQYFYPSLFLQSGFQEFHKYYTSISQVRDVAVDAVLEQQIKASGVAIRTVQLDNFEEELKAIFPLCSVAFEENLLFSPISESKFLEKYLPMKPLIDPQFLLIAEKDQRPCAFMLCFPDANAKEKMLIIKTVAKSAPSPKGLITLMTQMIYHSAFTKGFEKILHVYMHEHNRSLKLSEQFGGRPYKQHMLFVKEVK